MNSCESRLVAAKDAAVLIPTHSTTAVQDELGEFPVREIQHVPRGHIEEFFELLFFRKGQVRHCLWYSTSSPTGRTL